MEKEKQIITHRININYMYFVPFLFGKVGNTNLITPDSLKYNPHAYSGTDRVVPLCDLTFFALKLEEELNSLFKNISLYKDKEISIWLNDSSIIKIEGQLGKFQETDPKNIEYLFAGSHTFEKDGKDCLLLNRGNVSDDTIENLTHIHDYFFNSVGYDSSMFSSKRRICFTDENFMHPEKRGITFAPGRDIDEYNWEKIRNTASFCIYELIKKQADLQETPEFSQLKIQTLTAKIILKLLGEHSKSYIPGHNFLSDAYAENFQNLVEEVCEQAAK